MTNFSWFGRLAVGSACAFCLGSASASEPALNKASIPMVWVSANGPADGITTLAVGTGLLVFASGTIVGGSISILHSSDEYGFIPGAVSMGTILPLTLIPGIIMLAVGVHQAEARTRTNDDPDDFMTRSDVERKRTAGLAITIGGAIITGLSTVAIAAGPPLLATCVYQGCNSTAHDAGVDLMSLGVPFSILGTVSMGIGVYSYVKYDYALNPHKYEAKAAQALTSFRLAPYASQGGSGLLLSGTF